MASCKRVECGECIPLFSYYVNQQEAIFNEDASITPECPQGYTCENVDPVVILAGTKKIIPDVPTYDPNLDPDCDYLCQMDLVLQDAVPPVYGTAYAVNQEQEIKCSDVYPGSTGDATYTVAYGSFTVPYNPATTNPAVAQAQANEMAREYGKLIFLQKVARFEILCDDTDPMPDYDGRVVDTWEANASYTVPAVYSSDVFVGPIVDNGGRPGTLVPSGCIVFDGLIPGPPDGSEPDIPFTVQFADLGGHIPPAAPPYDGYVQWYIGVECYGEVGAAAGRVQFDIKDCGSATSSYGTTARQWRYIGPNVARQFDSVAGPSKHLYITSASGSVTYTNYLYKGNKYQMPPTLDCSAFVEATKDIPLSDSVIPSALPQWGGGMTLQPWSLVGYNEYRPLLQSDDCVDTDLAASMHGYELGSSGFDANSSITIKPIDNVPDWQLPSLPVPSSGFHSVWRLKVDIGYSDSIVAVKPFGYLPKGIYSTRPDLEGASSRNWTTHVDASTTEAIPEFTVVGNNATAVSNGRLPDIDGIELNAYDYILVMHQLSPETNGIYRVTSVGSESTPFTLERRHIATYKSPASYRGRICASRYGTQAFKFFVVNQSVATLNVDPIVWGEFPIVSFEVV